MPSTSHRLSQCWPRSLSPYDVTRPQCVKALSEHFMTFEYTCNYDICDVKCVRKVWLKVCSIGENSLTFCSVTIWISNQKETLLYELPLTHCGPVRCVWHKSGTTLAKDGDKPLPEPRLTYHQWDSVGLIEGQCHKNPPVYKFKQNVFANYTYKLLPQPTGTKLVEWYASETVSKFEHFIQEYIIWNIFCNIAAILVKMGWWAYSQGISNA